MSFPKIEIPALEVVAVVKLVVPKSKVSMPMLTMLQTRDILHPRGETIARNRRHYTFADVLATAFLFDMRASGVQMIRLKKSVARIQAARGFKPNDVLKGRIESMTWSYEIGLLALRLAETLERSR